MKTKSWMIATALLAVVLCGAAMVVYAQQNESATAPAWRGHGHEHMGWMAKQLNLTEAQKEQVKSLMQANRGNTRPLMLQAAENRKAMLAATSGGAFDQAKVQALANQQAQTMAQLMVQKASLQHQIYTQVLTAEQRTTADQLRQKQMERIDQRLQKFSQPQAEPNAQ